MADIDINVNVPSQVSQTITNGVTDKAPSENTVFDALAGKQDVLGYTAENSANKTGTITPSATQYPNNNAVIDYVATSVRVISETTLDQTIVTGTTNNTISYAAPIPGNSFSVGKNPRINGRIRFTGSAGTRAIRMYVNSLPNLGGATLIGTIGVTLSTAVKDVSFSRMFTIKSATVSEFINTTTSVVSADGSVNADASNINIDWTQDQYIIYSIQLANSTDSGVVSASKITN